MVAAVLFGTMLLLFALSVPIPAALAFAAMAAIQTFGHVNFGVLIQRMFFGLDVFVILAVPLFIFLGELMLAAKITDRLVEFTQAFVGRLPGGLGQVAVVSNMLMAGISGSGTADAAATGVVLVPAMTRAGYGRGLAAALVGAAATIGPIFPPSIIMIVYASVAGVSIARMFVAGLLPGLLMGVALMVLIAVIARRQKIGVDGPPLSIRTMATATWRALLVLVMPMLVIGGILGGVFTPTESASVACIYGLFLALAIFRTVRLPDLPRLFGNAALTTGKVMFVLATASAFSWILARADAPRQLAELPIFSSHAAPWLIMTGLDVLMLLLGCVMEAIPILLIIVPMILPVAVKAGIDPIYLGVVMAANLSIGLVTPLIGSVTFVMCGISRVPLLEFGRQSLPFMAVLIIGLLVITYVPAIALFLPNLLLGPG
jgi:tripartite ATP-independent transporter DctM subunit